MFLDKFLRGVRKAVRRVERIVPKWLKGGEVQEPEQYETIDEEAARAAAEIEEITAAAQEVEEAYGEPAPYGEAFEWTEEDVEIEIEKALTLDTPDRVRALEVIYRETGSELAGEFYRMAQAELAREAEEAAEEALDEIDRWERAEMLFDSINTAGTPRDAMEAALELLDVAQGDPTLEQWAEVIFSEAERAEEGLERFAQGESVGIAVQIVGNGTGIFRHSFHSLEEAEEWVRNIPNGETIFALLPWAIVNGQRVTPNDLGMTPAEFIDWLRSQFNITRWGVDVYDVYTNAATV